MAVNKVVYGTTVLVDLTEDTVTADTLMQGYTAHDKSGALITGTADITEGSVYQDQDGYLVVDDSESSAPQGNLTITANGTYDVTQYAGATVDVVKTYTATISGTGNSAKCVVRKAGDAIDYYTDGNTFTFTENDDLEIHFAAPSTAYKGHVTVNGIESDSTITYIKTYIVSKPRTNLTIELSYSPSSDTYVNIVIPPALVGDVDGGGARSIGGYSFANVRGMSETDLKNFIQRGSTFTDINWPDGLTSIGSYAFAGCSHFNPSSLPSSLTSIGSYAFMSCSILALTSLPSGVTSIGANAFSGCKKLALASLPSGLTTIADYAFQNCNLLALTSLPSGIKNIFVYAFLNCYNLALTSLPSSLTAIQNYAFSCCESITSISCDGEITTLGYYAFNGSSSHPMQLESASFPNMSASNLYNTFGSTTDANACQQLAFCDIGSTSAIASNAFNNCYALQTLVLRKSDSICTLSNVNAFTNTPMRGYNSLTGTVYVPSALISTYQTATNWSTLYNAGTVTFAAIEGSEYERD